MNACEAQHGGGYSGAGLARWGGSDKVLAGDHIASHPLLAGCVGAHNKVAGHVCTPVNMIRSASNQLLAESVRDSSHCRLVGII